jgi:hypothetical protein
MRKIANRNGGVNGESFGYYTYLGWGFTLFTYVKELSLYLLVSRNLPPFFNACGSIVVSREFTPTLQVLLPRGICTS